MNAEIPPATKSPGRLDLVINRLRLAFYARYPLLFLAVLLLLGPIVLMASLSVLLANVLLVHSMAQTIALTIGCLISAKLLLVQMGVIIFNAPARFAEILETHVDEPFSDVASVEQFYIHWQWSLTKTFVWLIAGLSLPVTAVFYSEETRVTVADNLGEMLNTVDSTLGFVGVLLGILIDLGLFVMIAFVERLLVSSSATISDLLPIRIVFPSDAKRQRRKVPRQISAVLSGPGYTDPADAAGNIYFRPGHWQQLIVFALIVFGYFGLWKVTEGSTESAAIPILPTLFYAVLELTLLSTVLGGLSFFLDYYRLPISIVAIGAIAFSYWVFDRDHTFPTPTCDDAIGPPHFIDVVRAKAERLPRDKQNRRTMIVVTAPGGGIHAAAWTAQVLTGLHLRYGEEYANSLCMISAVSGGSVGTMYYAANFNVLQNPDFADDLESNCNSIVERAGGSSLEAIGWGLVFRDLPALLVPRSIQGDRGSVLDGCWQSRLFLTGQNRLANRTLTGWRAATLRGEMPIVVFNATEVESGRRVLFSSAYTDARESLREESQDDAAPVEFSRTYPNRDLNVVTAARLSATFPYVTPTATPDNAVLIGHMADGGYADNEGIETVIDWVSKLTDHYTEVDAEPVPFDRILILRIRHQVPADPLKRSNLDDGADADEQTKKRARHGFQFAAFGPIEAVLTVRSASQVASGQMEVDLLQDAPRKLAKSKRRFEIESLFLDFSASDQDHPPPLSWKLSPVEFSKYRKAWNKLVVGPAIKHIDTNYFSSQQPAR